ncbi:MAG TPA: hypothetical protein VFY14_12315 [Streptomyces sp.]|nr:hypothetical protein [Streptomyces sp.]
MGVSPRTSTPNGGTGCLLDRDRQHVTSTPCRRTGPRRWLRAVVWAVAAGLHPRATATTLTVAEDLASRMHYDTGHALYALDTMVARLGLSRSCITGHVKILRELGLLAWVSQGSRTNLRRALGLPGYAGTATVYAATIPPAYDTAMGHRLVGEGYTARAVVDHRTRPQPAVQQGPEEAPDTTGKRSTWTPSLRVVKREGKVELSGGFTTTAGAAANRNPAPTQKTSSSDHGRRSKTRRKRRTTVCGRPITGRMIQQARRLAPWIRARINWLQKATHDQISWVLLDPIARGWDEQRILNWAAAVGRVSHDGRTWMPTHPHRVLARDLLAEERHEEELAAAAREEAALARPATTPTPEFIAVMNAIYNPPTEGEETGLEDTPVTRDELWQLREEARHDLSLVLLHIDLTSRAEATEVFGVGLVARALNQQREGASA